MENNSPLETCGPPENPHYEELLKESHRLAKRIIALCKNADCSPFNSDIIIDGNITDANREDKTALISECGNGFGLVIKRLASAPEPITELDIIFYPHDWEKVNYLEGVETGLAEEYVKKQNQADRKTMETMDRELKNRGPRGVILSHLTVNFTNDTISPDKCRPILTRLSLILSDNTTIVFDPLMNHKDIREESGPYARIVVKRFLDRLSEAIDEEEKFAISMLFDKAMGGSSALNGFMDRLTTSKSDTGKTKPETGHIIKRILN